jgi:hypothetical protein
METFEKGFAIMKTVKKKKVVKRVSDAQAKNLTKEGWRYVPKSEWKKVRDADKK